jgi:hypothetical protein
VISIVGVIVTAILKLGTLLSRHWPEHILEIKEFTAEARRSAEFAEKI